MLHGLPDIALPIQLDFLDFWVGLQQPGAPQGPLVEVGDDLAMVVDRIWPTTARASMVAGVMKKNEGKLNHHIKRNNTIFHLLTAKDLDGALGVRSVCIHVEAMTLNGDTFLLTGGIGTDQFRMPSLEMDEKDNLEVGRCRLAAQVGLVLQDRELLGGVDDVGPTEKAHIGGCGYHRSCKWWNEGGGNI